MFTEAILTITKKWTQLKHASANEQVDKMRCIHIGILLNIIIIIWNTIIIIGILFSH